MTKWRFAFIKRERALRILATVCFLVLLILQYRLVWSSYEIENREMAKTEKKAIKQYYEQAIINDKLYPGGQKIIDKFLDRKAISGLAEWGGDNEQFKDSTATLLNLIVQELQENSNIDSLLMAGLKPLHLELDGYGYALILERFAITFDGRRYMDLTGDDPYTLPVLIAGDSNYVHPDHVVSSITVSAYSPYSCQVKFVLYGHDLSQNFRVFKKIFPLLALIALCVVVIVATYMATFSSWQKQKKLNEISQDFLNSITHEFKTPISSISVSVKNLYRETKGYKNEQVDQSIHVIDRQSKRIDHLVDQAIGIASFDPSQANLDYHNLTDDLEKIVYDLRLKYVHNPDVSIIFETEAQEAFAQYDLFYLTTAINNLIDNGIKHNDSVHQQVTVTLIDKETEIIIDITDNGVGISKEERPQVFRKFYQGQHGRERGGLGVGLYYVDQMVRVHGWQLAIIPGENVGTSVRIMIPKKEKVRSYGG